MVNKKIIPKYLTTGDTIALVAPAGIIKPEYIDKAVKVLKLWGYKTIVGENVLKNSGVFSANDKQRLYDFNKAINNPDVKAIMAIRGGYGSARIIDKIDIQALLKQPKWIIGFSDITVFHLALNKINIASMHGCMPVNFADTDTNSLETLHNCLSGKKTDLTIKSHKLNRQGKVQGEITGGNLSIIYSLNSTDYEINTNEKILFIEDLSEYLYHLDRMMLNLKLSGKLNNLKALVVGGMSNMKDGASKFGKSAYEIIYDYVKDYNYPLVFDFPAGHIHKNICLKFGVTYTISVDDKFVSISG